MSWERQRPQQALLLPVASDDDEILAVLRPDFTLHIIDIRSGRWLTHLSLPKTIRQSIGDVKSIRWSPESLTFQDDHTSITRRWTLLVYSTRVVALTVDVSDKQALLQKEATPLVDYQLEDHLGKIMFADFAISHEHILVIFETALHASMLSTVSPNRSDIPLPKYPDSRGVAQSPLRNSFALIIKSKGQDSIAIFTSVDGVVGQPVVFAAGTSDIQALRWSPNGDPIIAAWDTAAQGIKVMFFTAMGHPLRKLEVNDTSLLPNQSLPGIGVSYFVWAKSPLHDTIQAIGDGHGNVYIRTQNNREMTTAAISQFKHNSAVDGSTYIVWQENDEQAFIQQEIVLDLQFDQDTPIDDLAFNSDTTFLASKINTYPKGLWIWQINKSIPVTVFLFRHEVKQIAWHPSNPHVLITTTNSKKPVFFCWHDIQLPPQIMNTDLPNIGPQSRWRVQWMQTQPGRRVPLMISSPRTFDIGLLHRTQDHITFQTTLKPENSSESESIMFVETPSKPSRQGMVHSSNRMLDDIMRITDELTLATEDAW